MITRNPVIFQPGSLPYVCTISPYVLSGVGGGQLARLATAVGLPEQLGYALRGAIAVPVEHRHVVFGLQGAGEHPTDADTADVVAIIQRRNQGLQRSRGVEFRRRNVVDDGLCYPLLALQADWRKPGGFRAVYCPALAASTVSEAWAETRDDPNGGHRP
jgi:hypothetical protein